MAGGKINQTWSQWWDLNPRLALYERATLPLSYIGILGSKSALLKRKVTLLFCLQKSKLRLPLRKLNLLCKL